MRELFRRFLVEAGHQVAAVADGADALEILLGAQFQVAILDVNMPRMKGPDVIAQLHLTVPRDAWPRIIIISADSTPASRDAALASGADVYLCKPFEQITLLSALREGDVDRPEIT